MKSTGLKLLLSTTLFFLATSGWAQMRKISGKVTDESNNPLSGVSIIVTGKAQGTQSDVNGNYYIDASPNDELKFSSVGFSSTTIKVGSSSAIDVVLKVANSKLDEVVVVGYGTQTRRTLTGSVASLDQNVLKSSPNSNLGTALQGTLPGLRVQQSTGNWLAAPLPMRTGREPR